MILKKCISFSEDRFFFANGADLMKCRIIWASTLENLSSGVGEKQRRSSACRSAHFDQRLCFSLFGKVSYQTLLQAKFIFLASLCS